MLPELTRDVKLWPEEPTLPTVFPGRSSHSRYRAPPPCDSRKRESVRSRSQPTSDKSAHRPYLTREETRRTPVGDWPCASLSGAGGDARTFLPFPHHPGPARGHECLSTTELGLAAQSGRGRSPFQPGPKRRLLILSQRPGLRVPDPDYWRYGVPEDPGAFPEGFSCSQSTLRLSPEGGVSRSNQPAGRSRVWWRERP